MKEIIKAKIEALKAEGKEPHGELREWAIDLGLLEEKDWKVLFLFADACEIINNLARLKTLTL